MFELCINLEFNTLSTIICLNYSEIQMPSKRAPPPPPPLRNPRTKLTFTQSDSTQNISSSRISLRTISIQLIKGKFDQLQCFRSLNSNIRTLLQLTIFLLPSLLQAIVVHVPSCLLFSFFQAQVVLDLRSRRSKMPHLKAMHQSTSNRYFRKVRRWRTADCNLEM